MILPPKTILLQRISAPFLNLPPDRLQWFNIPQNNENITPGNTYIQVFHTLKPLLLLNLGNKAHRKEIIKRTTLTEKHIHPDNQYSGHDTNTYVHKILKLHFESEYDGTIISKEYADTTLNDTVDGIDEIVLFSSHNLIPKTIIQPIHYELYEDFVLHSTEF
jgi:leucyl-tRNA synthetase